MKYFMPYDLEKTLIFYDKNNLSNYDKIYNHLLDLGYSMIPQVPIGDYFNKINNFIDLADFIMQSKVLDLNDKFFKVDNVGLDNFFFYKSYLRNSIIIDSKKDNLTSQIKYELIRKNLSLDNKIINNIKKEYNRINNISEQIIVKNKKKQIFALALYSVFRDKNPLPAHAKDYMKICRPLINKLGLNIKYDNKKLVKNILTKFFKDFYFPDNIKEEILSYETKLNLTEVNAFTYVGAVLVKLVRKHNLPITLKQVAEKLGISTGSIRLNLPKL